MDSKTLKLKHPIKYGSEEIQELTFKKPKAKDLRGLKIGSTLTMGDIIDLGAKMSGNAPSVLDELEVDDLMEVAEIVGNFIGSSQETGKIN